MTVAISPGCASKNHTIQYHAKTLAIKSSGLDLLLLFVSSHSS